MLKEKFVSCPESRSKLSQADKKIVQDEADKLLLDFKPIDRTPWLLPKRFLESLIPKVSLKNNVDLERHPLPYIVEPNNSAFLILKRKSVSILVPHTVTQYHYNSSYEYTEVLALGYEKDKDGIEVGFFSRNENDRYLNEHRERKNFIPLEIGMLFSKTVPEKEIIPTLALAMASYQFNQEKENCNQVIFPANLQKLGHFLYR